MAFQQVSNPTTWPDPTVEPDAQAMTLQEAALHLGLTEAEVLMRVFRGALPSVVGRDGCRRVLREVLGDAARGEGRSEPGGETTAAEYVALGLELAAARTRIAALELGERLREESLADRLEALAEELEQARARIEVLEAGGSRARAA